MSLFKKWLPFTAYCMKRKMLMKAESAVYDLAFEYAGRGGGHHHAVMDAFEALRELRLKWYPRKSYDEFAAAPPRSPATTAEK